MIYLGLLFAEVAILYFLSKKVTGILFRFMSINFLSFLFLPGVIIHELSHLLTAIVLFVRVGNMEFTPQKSHNGVKLGSIEIARTDPIRRSIIGFAPVFVGLAIIIAIVYFFSNNVLFFKDKSLYFVVISIILIGYLLFAISNTMFSSKADMEGTVEIIATLLIIIILLYLIGVRVPLSAIFVFLESNIELVRKLTLFLLVPITVDLLVLGIIRRIKRVES